MFCGLLPAQLAGPDQVSKETKTYKKILEEEPTQSTENGVERLKNIFKLDEFGGVSQELNSVYQGGLCGFLIGAIYGGVIQSRVGYMDFMESNQATAFKSHLDAKRKLQDQFTVNFAKGAMKWGWRIGLFTTSYLGIITCVSVYREKSSIFEYMAAGFASGSIYKFKMGLRGMAAGGIVGSALGAVGGCASLLIMQVTGTSMEDVRFWQQHWRMKRELQVREAFKVQAERDNPDLLKTFAKRTADNEVTLENIEDK